MPQTPSIYEEKPYLHRSHSHKRWLLSSLYNIHTQILSVRSSVTNETTNLATHKALLTAYELFLPFVKNQPFYVYTVLVCESLSAHSLSPTHTYTFCMLLLSSSAILRFFYIYEVVYFLCSFICTCTVCSYLLDLFLEYNSLYCPLFQMLLLYASFVYHIFSFFFGFCARVFLIGVLFFSFWLFFVVLPL